MKFARTLFASAALAAVAVASPATADKVQISAAASADIVDTAAAAGQFKTLLAAAKAAGLVGVLKSKGPLTVFAPTDAAFAKLPKGTVAMLLKPENKAKLAAVLKYHVLPGKVMAKEIVGNSFYSKTAQGQMIKIDGTGDSVMVQNAKVIKADIVTSNGVVHVIDTVIVPKN